MPLAGAQQLAVEAPEVHDLVLRAAREEPGPGRSVIITGPNENSQKASISVYVLAANNDPDWVSNGKQAARDLYTESGQTLQGSFSAVSKPNFASKHSYKSSPLDLHNALLCTVLDFFVTSC